MEQQEEHEVYGGEIPDEGEMDADLEMSARIEDGEDEHDGPSDPNKDLEDMKKRLKEIEDEASALREMQAKVEKEMGLVQGSSASQAEKEEVDSRSIYVGNIQYVLDPLIDLDVLIRFESYVGTVRVSQSLLNGFGF
ncbi:hypothetical protein L6164_005569 [Bauhinia variegata]|uniref:Uncharacterized protein n=1 Tax=Bauhinia variegata TaxID=167791 RepID=A0ACB9PQY0_BAUVA|nr:hypothetical protein L6164_005569 [Bauhinia variegata]